jgi:hypothetical protein
MKIAKKSTVSLLMGVLSANLAIALDLEKPTANLTEKWNSDAGWVANFSPNADSASAGWTNYLLAAKFQGLVGMPHAQNALLMGLPTSSDGRYSGNFGKIDEVSFDVSIQNSPKLIFYFKSATGVSWKRRISGLPESTTLGQSTNVVVKLTQDPGWYSYITAEDQVPDYVADKASVVEVGFEVQRNIGTAYTAYNDVNVDNFKLIGKWGQPYVNRFGELDPNGVPMAWLLENNMSTGTNAVDSDGDGFSIIAEFLAGTDPNDSNSFFRIEIGKNAQGKALVKWKDNKFVLFDLLESTDLNLPFTGVTGAVAIQGTGSASKHEVLVDDSGVGAHFYKVQVRPMP